ncbi:UNKNOWN [Stylonychia lemnae]|uniref:Uncharacterized protein n=1 Tax=Stylonychia lemnae TaxID=5949 RepID=A0A078B1K1_STYLE|nr:UNKNOWN [Stylonychia lemnae]|eukprot:CDW87143.1 UNKNOWN [Stylonychia lemnae]
MDSNQKSDKNQKPPVNDHDDDDFDSLLQDAAKKLDQKVQPKADANAQKQSAGTQQRSVQDDLGLAGDIDFSKLNLGEGDMAEAQKLLEECMKSMGNVQDENPNMENPFLLACNQMFKDFENIQKEDKQSNPTSQGNATGGGQSIPGMEGLGADDPMFMNLLNNLAKDLLNGDPAAQEGALDNLMNQFQDFMKDSDQNEEMKSALESVVQEIIKKDTLYDPMKTLRDEFPKWLEENWQSISDEDLERYNKQHDKIQEICKVYEDNKSEDSNLVFELLSQLQELGSPPQDLMKKVADTSFGQSNPFNKM